MSHSWHSRKPTETVTEHSEFDDEDSIQDARAPNETTRE